MLTKKKLSFKCIAIESHPQDSRVKMVNANVNQPLTSNMGNDAANGGLVLVQTYKKQGHAKFKGDGQGWEETIINDTLTIFDNGETRTPTLILENHPADSRITISKDNIVQTLSGRMGTGGGNTPMVMESREPVLLESNQDHATIREDGICTSLVASAGEGGGYVPMVTQAVSIGNGQLHDAQSPLFEVSKTLNCMDDPAKIIEVNSQDDVKCIGNGQTAQMGLHDKTYSLDCMHDQQALLQNLVVRRLTPLECSRLQGYPDGWMDIGEWTDSKGKLHKDSDAPKYKAAGNSIALPFWQWLMDRIAKQLKKDGCENPTMASLFDGISGFPLCAIRSGIKPVWSSEIEEFPMAVAERHFGENGDLEKFL